VLAAQGIPLTASMHEHFLRKLKQKEFHRTYQKSAAFKEARKERKRKRSNVQARAEAAVGGYRASSQPNSGGVACVARRTRAARTPCAHCGKRNHLSQNCPSVRNSAVASGAMSAEDLARIAMVGVRRAHA